MLKDNSYGLSPMEVDVKHGIINQNDEESSSDNDSLNDGNTDGLKNDEEIKKNLQKEEIKVGVGGLYIVNLSTSSSNKDYILMYKRYKDPEIHQWSLLGGHVGLYQTCEDTLKEKIYRLTSHQIQKRDIEVLDVIHTVNHFNEDEHYHYVSPQYYVDIKQTEFEKIKTIRSLSKTANSIVIISTSNQLKKSMTAEYNSVSTEERPWLSLIALDVFEEINRDNTTRLEDFFIHTTVEALLRHLELQKHIHSIETVTYKYKQWKKV